MKKMLLAIVILASIGSGILLGYGFSIRNVDKLALATARLQGLQTSHELQTFLEAISLLDQGKNEDAKNFISRQLKSGFTVLTTLRPNLNLSPEDMAIVDDSLVKSERYLKDHK